LMTEIDKADKTDEYTQLKPAEKIKICFAARIFFNEFVTTKNGVTLLGAGQYSHELQRAYEYLHAKYTAAGFDDTTLTKDEFKAKYLAWKYGPLFRSLVGFPDVAVATRIDENVGNTS
jgi:hypothetical protein